LAIGRLKFEIARLLCTRVAKSGHGWSMRRLRRAISMEREPSTRSGFIGMLLAEVLWSACGSAAPIGRSGNEAMPRVFASTSSLA
jgi:hypothetical protein